MERQRLLTRTPLPGEHCYVATNEGGAGDAMSGSSELFEVTKSTPALLSWHWLGPASLLFVLTGAGRQSLCIATQERKLLTREKGVLESILKSTMEEISRMLEVEALNNEQVGCASKAFARANACMNVGTGCPRITFRA